MFSQFIFLRQLFAYMDSDMDVYDNLCMKSNVATQFITVMADSFSFSDY